MSAARRLLLVDLSVDPRVYRPVEHWRPHIEAVGVPFDVSRPPGNQWPADLAPYSHAILTGSEASVLSDTDWILRTCVLARALSARQVKLLGSCFGHQMLARSLAGREFVRRTPTPEFGWIELRTRATDFRDPIAAALSDRCYVYASHFDEVFPLPDGWDVVAETADCPYAVVRSADASAWGIQPHPEIGIEEGQALHSSYLKGMPERRDVLEAGWHGEQRDDRVAAAIVKAFLDA